MHAIAVVFDFVEPLVAFRRRVDELRQLRPDPLGQRVRSDAQGGYRSRHAGGRKRLQCRLTSPEILAYPSATARRAPMVSAAS